MNNSQSKQNKNKDPSQIIDKNNICKNMDRNEGNLAPQDKVPTQKKQNNEKITTSSGQENADATNKKRKSLSKPK